jgi:hypothetical protein
MESTVKRVILPIAATLILVGCGTGNDESETVVVESTQESTDATEGRREVRRRSEDDPQRSTGTGDEVPRLPRLEGAAESDGYGLTMIVDGSSPEAFNESLALIAEDTSQSQYQELESAVRYLRMYSPHGWGGAEALYAALDGMSGEEIIEKANERRAARGR